MQTPQLKLRQNSIIFEKPGYLSEKLKSSNWQAPTTTEFNIFMLKFSTCFLLSKVYKRACGKIFFVSLSFVSFVNVHKISILLSL